MTLASASDRSPDGCTSWRETYRIQNSNPLAFATSQMPRLSTELASNPCTPGGAATIFPGSGILRLQHSCAKALSDGQKAYAGSKSRSATLSCQIEECYPCINPRLRACHARAQVLARWSPPAAACGSPRKLPRCLPPWRLAQARPSYRSTGHALPASGPEKTPPARNL